MAELCEDSFGWGPLVSPQPPYLLTPCFGEMVVYLIPQFAAFVYFSSSALFCRTKEHKQEVLLSTWDSRLLTSRMVFAFLAALAFAGFWLIRFFTDVPIQNYYYFQIVIGTLAHIAAIAHQRIVFFRKYSGDGALLLFWLSNILVDALRLRMLIVVFSDKLDYWTISILALHAFFAIVAFILEMTNKEYSNWAAWLGDEDGHLCPESYSNFFSIVTFWWMNGLIRKGYKQSLVDGDLWRLPAFLRPRLVFNRFAPYWFDELKKPLERQSILWALFRCHGFYLAYGGSLKLVQDLLGFAQPFLLQELIAFVTEATEKPEGEVNLETGLLIAVAMFVTAITQTIFLHQYFHASISCGVQVRSEITSMLYRKSLVLNNKARQASSVGEVVTQMSIDAQRIQDMLQYVHHLWSAPLTIGLSLAFLYLVLGPSIFAGLGAMVLMIPINGVVAWRMSILQTQQMTNKDMRIKLMDEVLGGIRVIKLYSWEKAFMRRVIGIRDQEITTLRGIAIYDAIQNFTWTAAPFLVSLASFTTYTLTGQILTSEKAFVALSLFNILQFPLMIFPMLISGIVDVRVSLSRLKKFFQAEELDKEAIGHASTATEITEEEDDLTFAAGRRDGYAPISTNDDRDENDGTSMHTSHQIGIIARNATFAWNDVTVPFLRDINFELRPGQLVAVVGPVGAGKSSLLAAILGEMIKCNGSLKVNGSIGYAPQQPWICNTTLAENIRFGQALDEQRYRAAIASCALLPDIAMLPSGDQTEIGEKGINLSGGQKQRVSLARAVYADADIYLLDDPLSAVDAHVGRHLFDQVIGPSGILRSKSRLLVTHSVTYLPQCDYFLVVRDGAIIERGTFTELMAESTSFKRLLTEFSAITKTDQASETHEEQTSVEYSLNKDENSEADQVKHDPKTLIDKEDVQVGAVKAAVYYDYFKTIGTGSVAFLLLLFVIGEAALVGSSLWLSYWSAQESNDQIGLYIGVYAAFGTLGAVFIVAQVLFGFVVCGLRAAARLHAALLSNVMRAPMSFFDTTPTGRIVNRFSKDQYTIDEVLPQAFLSYLRQVFIVIGILVVISLSTPVFIIAVVPLGLLYWFIQVYYINTSRQLKRLDSVSKSPIFAHFQETLQGVVTIRAFGHQSRFIRENESRVDMNQRPFYASVSSNRWLATRLEFIGATIVFLSALFSVLGYKTISPSLVGLSVSYALQVTSELNWMVRMASDVETNVVAVERVREYTRIETEAPDSIPANLPSSKWPQEGAITFDHYGTRYRAGLDLVLQDVSFSVLPHEKIGVCGRTGAGKSSLTQALFRLLEPAEGHIDIDQCNTTLLGLHDLRSRLTIIPQDPVLFSGSLRYNLDPFTERTDDEIWQALEHASLKQTVEKLPNKLDSEVLSSGENFSVGQRQLLCLARALLRKSSILVLDEATAAVDLETDSIVQATIRREFAECTIFTIAHRLNTIMDSNRVLVLDKGQVKEFDSPSALLANPNSEFYGLAKQAGLV